MLVEVEEQLVIGRGASGTFLQMPGHRGETDGGTDGDLMIGSRRPSAVPGGSTAALQRLREAAIVLDLGHRAPAPLFTCQSDVFVCVPPRPRDGLIASCPLQWRGQ